MPSPIHWQARCPAPAERTTHARNVTAHPMAMLIVHDSHDNSTKRASSGTALLKSGNQSTGDDLRRIATSTSAQGGDDQNIDARGSSGNKDSTPKIREPRLQLSISASRCL